VRSASVTLLTPLINFPSCLSQRSEPVPIEAFVPELAVKTLDEGDLCRLVRLDKAELHSLLLGPEEHRLAGKFWQVVTNNDWRQVSLTGQLI